MSEYTNLTSLEGLKVGDIVTYDSTTPIDFKGYKVKVELYGYSYTTSSPYGGYASFVINSALLPQTILSFNNSGTNARDLRNDLIYGNTDSLYYRIAVAGNSGSSRRGGSATGVVGKGGDIVGGRGKNTYDSTWYVNGGSQLSGGKLNTSAYNYSSAKYNDGSFGLGADRIYYSITGNYSGYGGYGWYGGGTAECKMSSSASSYFTGGSGGSGFVIGFSTTTYPAGYLGDDTTLINTISSAISEAQLTQGTSSETTPKMILTIISVSVPTTSSTSEIQYYTSNNFVPTNPYYYNGSEFVLCDAYYYDGDSFKKI